MKPEANSQDIINALKSQRNAAQDQAADLHATVMALSRVAAAQANEIATLKAADPTHTEPADGL
tara:strand:+ start:4352 stop:4543 length:192 start_codon:yes stop_codon:yes gene_type:complete